MANNLLITCNVFTTFNNLQGALQRAMEAGAKVPAAGGRTGETLAEVIAQCEGAIKHAKRLQLANVQPAQPLPDWMEAEAGAVAAVGAVGPVAPTAKNGADVLNHAMEAKGGL